MTDKEIAQSLRDARWDSVMVREFIKDGDNYHANYSAYCSVRTIHHIINSINWED